MFGRAQADRGMSGWSSPGSRSVRGKFACQAAVSFGAGVVEADDLRGLALALVLGGDGVECGDGGGVPNVGVGEVNDDLVGVVGVLELGVQVVAGGEEQFTGHSIDRGGVAVG